MATAPGSIVALAAALALAATVLPARAATFVYVGCTDSNEIHVLQLDPQRPHARRESDDPGHRQDGGLDTDGAEP